jgi:hypothetical protein
VSMNGGAMKRKKLMKTLIGVLSVLVLAAGAIGLSRALTDSPTTAAAAEPSAPAATRCEGDRMFGHIETLTAKGDQYELRFDPAWFLSGETANRAAAEDGAVQPGEPVPNDNYVVEEGHRLLTFLVQPTAHVTVLVRNASEGDFGSKTITVDELAQLVEGRNPVELFEPLESGIWLRIHIDTACSVEQQYRP